jgi:hypothetical protein
MMSKNARQIITRSKDPPEAATVARAEVSGWSSAYEIALDIFETALRKREARGRGARGIKLARPLDDQTNERSERV